MFKYIKISATSTILLLLSLSALAHYPYVQIQNKTDRAVFGTVHYSGEPAGDCQGRMGFCTCDHYSIAPHKNWEASSRGYCRVIYIEVSWDGDKKDTGVRFWSDFAFGTKHAKFSVIRCITGEPKVVKR